MKKKIIVATVILAGINCGLGIAGTVLGGGMLYGAAVAAGAVHLGLFYWVNK